jgi:diguanylate cyclase (GGDEF)-like protein/putative nucleotidyltransferase with HDIG domain
MPPEGRVATVAYAEERARDEAMSAASGTGTMSARGSTLPVRELTPRAIVYCGVVMAFAASVAAPLLTHVTASGDQWAAFVVFASCAAVAQLFTVQTPRNHGFQTTNVFLIPAVLLLPAPLVALIAIVQHVPEWLRSRKAWYVQSFNIANYTLDALAAWAVAHAIEHSGLIGSTHAREALAGAGAALTFVLLNHVLLAVMLNLARSYSLRETELFTFDGLSTELILAGLGVGVATFWRLNPWLIPFGLAPLVLIHRSLAVPQLQAEARVDPKTGLFNARHFAATLAEELGRAERFERPLSLIMADLDLLRDINNSYGHLAGDAVLKGIAEVFRAELRHYDVPARFGGEEFSILLPETAPEEALEIAERIRRAVAAAAFDVETSSDPIHATVSIGVAGYPKDAHDANELIHQADLAVYRAKLQGRNRVLGVSSETILITSDRAKRLVAVPEEGEHVVPLPPAVEARQAGERRQTRRHAAHGPRFFALSARLTLLVGVVSSLGMGTGILGLMTGGSHEVFGLLAVVGLVGISQALALEADVGSISVSAVGALAGAALFGPRVALPLAVTITAVEWSARRPGLQHVLFNIGALSLASLSAAGVFLIGRDLGPDLTIPVVGLAAGTAYFVVNNALVSLALALEGHERWWTVWRERFAWLLTHYLAYGFVGGVMALGYLLVGPYALAVFAIPLLLIRKTQEAYLAHTQRAAQKLREAAETIHRQNVSLEQANRLLRERSTAAMESLSATVDARDSYTAGHSRRVQQLALAIGGELGLSQAELDLLGHAALFHDIGKLAIPDAVLLKPASLTTDEWALMRQHAAEGARIIDRLGFLDDAVPAIRHHHERFDGTGYPDRLKGEEIPLGARIIHVADALDSMLTTRIYRAARPAAEALDELRRAAGTQFCPRCVTALERILPLEAQELEDALLLAAS